MCNTSTEQNTSQNATQSSTVQPTAEEQAFIKSLQSQFNQTSGLQTGLQTNLLNLANMLSSGSAIGAYGKLFSGIDANTVANQATQYALNAVPSFQSLGLADSGTAVKNIAKGIATDIQLPVEEYNLGLLGSLLSSAFSGGATASSLTQGTANTLASTLAGLRGTTVIGSGSISTTQTQNPFLNSLYSSLGSGLGKVATNPFL